VQQPPEQLRKLWREEGVAETHFLDDREVMLIRSLRFRDRSGPEGSTPQGL
jgi:hypothetical protein